MIFRVYQGSIGEFGTYQNFRKTDCQIIDNGKSDLSRSTKCGQLCGTAVVFCTVAVREGVKKNPFFYLGLCPKLWVGGGQKF